LFPDGRRLPASQFPSVAASLPPTTTFPHLEDQAAIRSSRWRASFARSERASRRRRPAPSNSREQPDTTTLPMVLRPVGRRLGGPYDGGAEARWTAAWRPVCRRRLIIIVMLVWENAW
jgi:hypothetical protein